MCFYQAPLVLTYFGLNAKRVVQKEIKASLVPLASFLTSRATLFCIGLLSHWALISPSQKLNHWHMDPRPWLDIWVGWDSQWYANIVQHGYHQYIATGPGGVPPEQGVAFFPLYPLLTWILDQLVADPLLSGVLVANLCAVGATMRVRSQRMRERKSINF